MDRFHLMSVFVAVAEEESFARGARRLKLSPPAVTRAIAMLEEEGLDNVFKRHDRHAEATRRAVNTWGLEMVCLNETEYSSALTAVMMPTGHSEIAFRKVVLDNFNMSLGSGLGKLTDKVFRIGHIGDFNDLTLMGTLAGVEMGLALAKVPHHKGGVDAAMASLTEIAIKSNT